jgi:hypothetical protein
MKLLSAVLTILAIALGLAVALPLVGVAIGFLFTLGAAFLWLLPIVIIAVSDETTTGEKVLWILAIVFLSWFAWVFYFLFAPLGQRPQRYRYY